MVFSSIVFLFLFLPLTLLAYFVVRNQPRLRNALLLVVSLAFYFWGEGAYTLVMLLYIVCNYYFAHLIEFFLKRNPAEVGRQHARRVLIGSLFFNLGFLTFYKYANFIASNIDYGLEFFGYSFKLDPIHLPIGISFFTFQAISYVVDVYRGDIKASRSLLNFAMYKAFFPQLIAGPIVRYKDVAKQIVSRHTTFKQFKYGVERFIIGLGKKVLIANTAAAVADQIFKIPAAELTPAASWLGIICYSLQIYFDFSGYSDMAIGMGHMFGFRFLENFNYPYIARSIKDFWRRWHISLSSWFRDYLYIPLGGNRAQGWRVYFNLVLVFFLCGLWHGASWSFVVWGLWHGLFLVLERTSFGAKLEKLAPPFQYAYTLLVVFVGWVFFRSDTLSGALAYLKAMFALGTWSSTAYPCSAYLSLDLMLVMVLGVLFSAPVVGLARRFRYSLLLWLRNKARSAYFWLCGVETVKSGCYLLVLSLCLVSLASGTHNPFIYFRF